VVGTVDAVPDAHRARPGRHPFLDEINRGAAHGLRRRLSASSPQVGEYVIPEGWAIFAAGRPPGRSRRHLRHAGAAGQPLHHYDVEANLDDWIGWALGKASTRASSASSGFAPTVFSFDPAHNPVAFPSPRPGNTRIARCTSFPTARPPGRRPASLRRAGVGVELKAFIDNMENLPDIDGISPATVVAVPRGIDLQYGVAAALGRAGGRRARGTWASSPTSSNTHAATRSAEDGRDAGDRPAPRPSASRCSPVPEFVEWANSVAE